MDGRRRILATFFLLALAFALVAGRLVQLQVFRGSELSARAERQQQRVVKLNPKRGTIFDRMGRELAVSVDVDSVYGVPAATGNPKALARQLGRILQKDPRALEQQLAGNARFVWLSRKIDPARAEKVKSLDSKTVGLLVESKRFYPKKALGGSLLGFTGIDNEGLEGVELAFDGALRGQSGWVLAEKDAVGRTAFAGGTALQYKLPQPGKDVVLTVDEVIQHIAEKELDVMLVETRAKSAVCIVMDPKTGAVLALAVRSTGGVKPAFNPNARQRYKPAEWRNRAITDVAEPGSTFKAILAAAALEEKIVTPNERFDCSAGKIAVAGRTIRDAKTHGILTFSDVIADSSNVGTIKVAMRLGKERLYEYIAAFGFGRKTGIDLSGEIGGLVKHHRLWQPSSIGSIAIGQEIGVTPIQMAAAYGAIANGGLLMKPYVVSEIVDPQGHDGRRFGPETVRRVISERTAEATRTILRAVVESGTGGRARPSGFTAAGKTGTAQKIDPGTGAYSLDEYVSSFIGFAPAEEPKLVIVVMVDSPKGAVLGGTVAAPVFKAVAEQSLAYLQVPPDDVGGRTLMVAK